MRKFSREFEHHTSNYFRLIHKGYKECPLKDLNQSIIQTERRNTYYLHNQRIYNGTSITYVERYAFSRYMKSRYGLNITKRPSKAFIIEHNSFNNNRSLVILETKTDCNLNSNINKLGQLPLLKEIYENYTKYYNFNVHLGLCVNTSLYDKLLSDKPEYKTVFSQYVRNNIIVLNGEHKEYHSYLDNWIANLIKKDCNKYSWYGSDVWIDNLTYK